MAKKTKGLSFDEKKAAMTAAMQKEGLFYNMKELESMAKRVGVIPQAVKEVVDCLIAERVIIQEKIGSLNIFWSFASNERIELERQLESCEATLQKSREEHAALEKQLATDFADSVTEKIPQASYSDTLKEIKTLELQLKQKQEEFGILQRSDPAVMEQTMASLSKAVESANQWTDNIYILRQFLCNKAGVCSSDVNRNLSRYILMIVPDAEEICLYSTSFDSGQRALWHLSRIGSFLDCAVAAACDKKTIESACSLVYAIPRRNSLGSHSSTSNSIMHHSSSADEIGLFGDSLSPRSVPEQSARPYSASSKPFNGPKYVRITESTRVKFLNPVSVTVFSVDMSPSMNVIDTSFKSVTTGCHLIGVNLVNCLVTCFKCLLEGRKAVQENLNLFDYAACSVIVTVIAHGVPDTPGGVYPLLIGERIESVEGIELLRSKIASKIETVIDRLSNWLKTHHVEEQLTGARNCSRTRTACTSKVCIANDITSVLRDALGALALTCDQVGLGLSKSSINKNVVMISDGVMAHPKKLPYDNILMHLNFIDVAFHFVQVGGGFAPWSALGYVSDPDLLRLLVSATPTGSYTQDHHLKEKAIVSIDQLNVFAKSLLFKVSSLSTFPRPGRKNHQPFKSATYQSSLALMEKSTSAGLTSTPAGTSTYIDLIGTSSYSRDTSIRIQGLETINFTQNALFSPSLSPSTIRKRVSSVDSMTARSDVSNDSGLDLDRSTSSEEEDGPTADSWSLGRRSYVSVGRSKVRPYLYKQYKLPGVSLARLIQIRVREGFEVESRAGSIMGQTTSILTSTASMENLLPPSLGRTASTASVQSGSRADGSAGAVSGGTAKNSLQAGLSSNRAVSLSMTWGATMEIVYEISEDSERGCRVKIFLRMPSGDFFLKFKQQMAVSVPAANETYFIQMAKQMDAFIETLFQVDDVLVKISNCWEQGAGSVLHTQPTGGVSARQSLSRGSSSSNSSSALYLKKPSQESLTEGDVFERSQNMEKLATQLLVQTLGFSPSALWHRWMNVRSCVFLVGSRKVTSTTSQVGSLTIRHGASARVIQTNREKMIDCLKRFPKTHEITPNTKYLVMLNDVRTSNVFDTNNSAIIDRLMLTSTGKDYQLLVQEDAEERTPHPFAIIEVVNLLAGATGASPGGMASFSGLVKLNLGFFATCHKMEQRFIESLSECFSECATLVESPSPILRSMAGLMGYDQSATTTSGKPERTSNSGMMGSGDSFYTFTPEIASVKLFLFHHAWEVVCPTASSLVEVMGKVHEARTKENWKCALETMNSLIYVGFDTPVNGSISKTYSKDNEHGLVKRESLKTWFPQKFDRIKLRPTVLSTPATNSIAVAVDWDIDDIATPPVQNTKATFKGSAACLYVQHVQQRGERPVLKCQAWVDHCHPKWANATAEERQNFFQQLVKLDDNQVVNR